MAFLTQDSKASFSEYAKKTDSYGADQLEILVSGVTQASQSTLLLKRRKEMREVDDALEFMKQEFRSRMEACNSRQREFEHKQKEMKEQVTRFEKFVQENDAKRTRADAKAKAERKLREQLEEKLNGLVSCLRQLQQEKVQLQDQLGRHTKYQTFLEQAVESSETEYDEVGDILNRYKTLQVANDDLKVMIQQADRESDRIRGQLNQLQRETQNSILVNNSEIHARQKELESIRETSFSLDSAREEGEKVTKDRYRESGQVIMSIKNLYNRCVNTSRSQIRISHAKDMPQIAQLNELLTVVEARITDLQSMVQGFKARPHHPVHEAEEGPSSNSE